MGKKVGKGQKDLGNGISTKGPTGHQGIKLILGRQDSMKGSCDQAFVLFFFVFGRRRCGKETDATDIMEITIIAVIVVIGCQQDKGILQG